MVHMYSGTLWSCLKECGGSLYTDMTYLHDTLFSENSKVQNGMYAVLPVHKRGAEEIICSHFLTPAQRTLEGGRETWWWVKPENWLEGAILGEISHRVSFYIVWSLTPVHTLMWWAPNRCQHSSRCWGHSSQKRKKNLCAPGNLHSNRGDR